MIIGGEHENKYKYEYKNEREQEQKREYQQSGSHESAKNLSVLGLVFAEMATCRPVFAFSPSNFQGYLSSSELVSSV